jgi:putative chitinase
MTIDRKSFFDSVKQSPANGHLTQAQVDGFNHILDEWERQILPSSPNEEEDQELGKKIFAYMLATCWHETAATMQPIEEFGKGHGKPYGVPDPVTHQTYYGRGYVQLTWKKNYLAMGQIIPADLVNHPELALDPAIAFRIMQEGMSRGTFTGKKMVDYFNFSKEDPFNARRIINGLDKAELIEGYYDNFLDALR